jgi:protocatechuate 3,4-dioxygenase beta subunit
MDRRGFALGLTATGALAAACSRATSATGEAGRPQVRADLYACEGCEAVAETDPGALSWLATLAEASEPGERMRLSGRVFAPGGVTPAPGVIVYAHHTNAEGLYANGAPDTVWSRRHGRLRGWVRTGVDGRYGFDTIKPAPYPDLSMPAHVHLFVGETGRRPYYIDDAVFDGEFGVDEAYRRRQELRGGSGIVRLVRGSDGVLEAMRDIRLEPHPA